MKQLLAIAGVLPALILLLCARSSADGPFPGTPDSLARGQIAKLPPAIAARDRQILDVLDSRIDARDLPLFATLTPQDNAYVVSGALGEIARLERVASATEYAGQFRAYVLRHFSALANAMMRPKTTDMWTASLQWNILESVGCAGDSGVLAWARHFVRADGSVDSWALAYPGVQNALACNATHADRAQLLNRALHAQGHDKWFWYGLYFAKAEKADVPSDLRIVDRITPAEPNDWSLQLSQTNYRMQLMALDPVTVLNDMLANPAHRPPRTYTFDILFTSAVIDGGLPLTRLRDYLLKMQLYPGGSLNEQLQAEQNIRATEERDLRSSLDKFFSTSPI
jgi:hypothetical protein